MLRFAAVALSACSLILACSVYSVAQELLPPDRPIHEAIDHYVAAKQQRAGVTPAPLADDANLLRRTTLDLVGRIPTVSETMTYLNGVDAQKRTEMVDRLMDSPAFVRHQGNEFNTLLMFGTGRDLKNYLLEAFGENRSWDQMFREMMLGEPDDDQQDGAIQFVKSRVQDLDKLTNEASVTFFGINVSCAQCHDHPLVPEWTQNHFYGMKSFFNRTFDNGGLIGEREYGLVQYQTVSGEKRDAELMFLTGTTIDEPDWQEPNDEQQKAEKKKLEELKKKKQPPPQPGFSRRAQLVEVALRDGENVLFAKSIVNRLWDRLFGRGFVMPVDQMHPENQPSHPLLLEWLARDLILHDYDLRRLMRGMLLSDTYARSSFWEGGDRPEDYLFAVGSVRPLTPYQYATALRLAASNPDQFDVDEKPDEVEKRLENIENSARGLAGQFEQPFSDFQVGVAEALHFSNNDRIQRELLRDSGDALIGKLKQLEDQEEVIETTFWTVFNRAPETEESAAVREYLDARKDRLDAAYRQLVWSLLASSESRFNH